MALYLNNAQYSSSNQQNNDTLICKYNKQFFPNYETAVTSLSQLTLLPGEMAFAYYYDSNTCDGQNSIFAVGPLSQGTNIIYKNSNDINNVINSLNETIVDINTSISYTENNINSSISSIYNNIKTLDSLINTNTNDIIDLKSNIVKNKYDIDTLVKELRKLQDDILHIKIKCGMIE